MRVDRGFTLIEILVVIVIVGITLSISLLAFGDFGAARKALVTAEQFASYTKLVQQRAILEVNALGITVNKNGYETLRFDNKASWQPMPKNSLFHWRPFPEQVAVSLQAVPGLHVKGPDIVIGPSGALTSFMLFFGTSTNPKLVSLKGLRNGDLVLRQASS